VDSSAYYFSQDSTADGQKSFNRWNFFWEDRKSHSSALSGGDFNGPMGMSYRLFNDTIPQCNNGDSIWNYLGPPNSVQLSGAPFLGIVTSVLAHPQDSSILYAGSNTSGLWKSIDGGAAWYNVTDYLGIPAMSISYLEMHPTNPSII